MKFGFLLFIMAFIASCNNESRSIDLAKEKYTQVQNENFEELLAIEFGTRGNVELWTYYFNSNYDSTYVWTYDLKNDSFDLTNHPNYERFKKEVNDPLGYVKDLEDKKNRLGLTAISNSPWPGHFVKFWFSERDVLIYLPNGFKIDSEPKQRWINEFNGGIKIDQNWVYLDLDKN